MDNQEIRERLAVIEEVVTRMEHRLFGNGSPGEMAGLSSRVLVLERLFWRALGATMLISMLLNIGAPMLLYRLLGKP